jgi:HD-like signal output (HDOD) protein
VAASKERAEGIARAFGNYKLKAAPASSVEDAVLRLKERVFDMVIAESQLDKNVSGTTFLAQTRKRLPLMQRVLIETSPLQISVHSLVNEVAPNAIFSGSVDTGKVWEMLGGGARGEGSRRRAGSFRGTAQALPYDERSELEKMEFITESSVAFNGMVEDPNLVLPVLPEIAVKVRQLMTNEKNTFETVADLVEKEQGMSARILQVANCPIYAGLERIRSLQQAVGRLGLRETRNILQAVVAQNLFRTEVRGLQEVMRGLWLHSICTAYGNEIIAQRLGIPDSSDYFMMGLLHDIGKLLILHLTVVGQREGRWTERQITEDAVRKLMAMRHHDLGARLLEKWTYPVSFQEVVLLHNDDAHIDRRSEPVVVTYFSNLLTRKAGFSLVPYEEDLMTRDGLADALNMSPQARADIEQTLGKTTESIKQSCFAE